MIKGLQSILMYVLPFPTSVSVCSSFNNWVSSFVSISTEPLLLHKTSKPTTHRIYIRSWWLCMQPFHPDTMAVWLVLRSTHQICHDVIRCELVRVGLIVYDSTGQESCRGTMYCIYWRSLYSWCRWRGAWSPEMFTTSMERWCTDWLGWIMTN